MAKHDDISTGHIHIPYNWTYANAAARTGAGGFVAGDVGKLARQTDDNSIWMLTATTPSWVQVNSSGSGVARSGATTDGNLAVWNGSSADSIKDGGVYTPGRVLIATSSPTGTGTQTFSSIPSTYTELLLRFAVRSTQAAANVNANLFLNNDNTAANYRQMFLIGTANNYIAGAGSDANTLNSDISADSGPANSFTIGTVLIPFYANTGFNKQMFVSLAHRRDTSSEQEHIVEFRIEWENAAAVNRIDMVLAAGNYKANSIFKLYGLL